jgi:hypothetical protein
MVIKITPCDRREAKIYPARIKILTGFLDVPAYFYMDGKQSIERRGA